MDKKKLVGRAVRSGILATAAATMLMGNIIAFAAEGDEEETAGIFWEEDLISGTVTEVGSDSITVRVAAAMEEGGFEMGRPDGQGIGMPGGQGMGMPDGQTPPELPDGQTPPELPDGQTPPERPEGELPDGQTPPELPDGQTRPERPEGEMPDGQTPPELPAGELPDGMMGPQQGGQPEGMPQGGQPEGMPQGGQPQGGQGMPSMGGQLGAEVVVNVNADTVVVTQDDAEGVSTTDITVGSNVMILLDGDTAISIMVMN